MSDPTPLRLHGYPVSNYFNIARAALIEKALPFEWTLARAGQDEAFLARNPMGKIPVLESPDGWIAETVAILEYLDDRYPAAPLRPADPGLRARGRQIVNVIQVYLETPARSLFPGVFMGGSNSPATVAAVRATLDRSTSALSRLMRPEPFLLGDTLSQADLFTFYNLDISDRLARFVWGRSLTAEIGGLEAWLTRMAKRDSTQAVLADFESSFTRYLADKGAAYRVEPATTEPEQLVHA